MKPIDINKLKNLSEDEIFFLIGKEMLKGDKSFMALSSMIVIEKAKVWFEINLPLFQEKICKNKAIINIYKNQETVVLTTALIDLIAGAISGIAPTSVAYLLYKRGVKILCSTIWEKQPVKL